MTDRELYSLYRRATGYRNKSDYDVRTYNQSLQKRIHTLVDAHFYLLLLVYGSVGVLLSLTALIALLLSLVNCTAGPLSTAAYLLNRHKDSLVSQEPSLDQVGSPESLSAIANYLASTVLRSAENAMNRCDAELAVLDRQIFNAESLEADLNTVAVKLQRGGLLAMCRDQIREAQDTKLYLISKRDNLLFQKQHAEAQLAPIQRQLEDLNLLATVSGRLRTLKTTVSKSEEQMLETTHGLAATQAEAETIQQTLPQISILAKAVAEANSEVRLLALE